MDDWDADWDDDWDESEEIVLEPGKKTFSTPVFSETFEGDSRFSWEFPTLDLKGEVIHFNESESRIKDRDQLVECCVPYTQSNYYPWGCAGQLSIKQSNQLHFTINFKTFPSCCATLLLYNFPSHSVETPWEALRIAADAMGYSEVLFYLVLSSSPYSAKHPPLKPISEVVNSRTGNTVCLYRFDPRRADTFASPSKNKTEELAKELTKEANPF